MFTTILLLNMLGAELEARLQQWQQTRVGAEVRASKSLCGPVSTGSFLGTT